MLGRITKTLVFFILLLTPALSFASVSINEIYYSPQSKSWIEIFNDTEATIDLSKYKILDSGAAVNGHGISSISGGTLGPHSYAVVAKDPTTLSGSYPLYKAALAAKTSGDTITLKDDSGNALDTVTFVSSQGAAGDGNSLQKSDMGWIAAVPTPGGVNATTPSQPTSTTNSDADVSTDNTSNSGGGGTFSTPTIQSGVATIVSTHYSYLPLSTFDARERLSVGAGRSRLSAAGSPVAFKAEIDVDSAPGTEFVWSFGDGVAGRGERIDHVYKYPGDYVVILNATNNGHTAVSRTQVKIVDPKLSITKASPSAIEIANNSKYEVNLYGWQLSSAGNTFVFPQDTIILPGQKIAFDKSVTNLAPASIGGVALETTSNAEVTNTSSNALSANDEALLKVLQEQAKDIQRGINEIAYEKYRSTHPNISAETSTPTPSDSTQLLATPALALQEFATTSTSTLPVTKPSTVGRWFSTLKHFIGIK